MKIIIKNNVNQQEIFLAVIKGDLEAKKKLESYMGEAFEQIINNKKLNQISVDWLCVEKLEIDVPINLKVTFYNKTLNGKKKKHNVPKLPTL